MPKQYTARELGKAVGVGPRTIQRYAKAGLIPKPPFRGRGTRYEHEHFVRARAAAHLARGGNALEWVREKLSGKTLDEIALYGGPPADEAANRLVVAERWAKIPLLPGLELAVRDGVSEFVHRVAIEIQRRYTA